MSEDKVNFKALDLERGYTLLQIFIDEVNADHSDVISVSRTKACYMRDAIEDMRQKLCLRQCVGVEKP